MTPSADPARVPPPLQNPDSSCLLWSCSDFGTDLLEIRSLGGHSRGYFCETHAREFCRVAWTRVPSADAPPAAVGEQMPLC